MVEKSNLEIFASIEDPKIPGVHLIDVRDMTLQGKLKKVLFIGVPNNRYLDKHPAFSRWVHSINPKLREMGVTSIIVKNE